jgi:hypothetical protein
MYTILLGHRGRGTPAHVCVDAPSYEVHRETHTARPEPGDPSNDTITTDALVYANHPLMRYHDDTALGRPHMARCLHRVSHADVHGSVHPIRGLMSWHVISPLMQCRDGAV